MQTAPVLGAMQTASALAATHANNGRVVAKKAILGEDCGENGCSLQSATRRCRFWGSQGAWGHYGGPSYGHGPEGRSRGSSKEANFPVDARRLTPPSGRCSIAMDGLWPPPRTHNPRYAPHWPRRPRSVGRAARRGIGPGDSIGTPEKRKTKAVSDKGVRSREQPPKRGGDGQPTSAKKRAGCFCRSS